MLLLSHVTVGAIVCSCGPVFRHVVECVVIISRPCQVEWRPGISRVRASLCKPVQACASLCRASIRAWRGARRHVVRFTMIGRTCMALAATRELDFGRYGHGGSICLSRVRASLCEPVQACASLWEASIRAWRGTRRHPVRFTIIARTCHGTGGGSRTHFGRYGRGGSIYHSQVRASLCEPMQACASLCRASIRVWRGTGRHPVRCTTIFPMYHDTGGDSRTHFGRYPLAYTTAYTAALTYTAASTVTSAVTSIRASLATTVTSALAYTVTSALDSTHPRHPRHPRLHPRLHSSLSYPLPIQPAPYADTASLSAAIGDRHWHRVLVPSRWPPPIDT